MLRLLDHAGVKPDLGNLLLMFLLQLGNDDLAEHLPFFHGVADVHVELLDETRDFGKNGRLLVGFDEAGLAHGEHQVAKFRPNHLDHGRADLAARHGGRDRGPGVAAMRIHGDGGGTHDQHGRRGYGEPSTCAGARFVQRR